MKTLAPLAFIAVAVIWASVIWALSSVLSGAPYAGPVLMYVGGGVAGTMLVLGGALRRRG